MNSAEPKKFKVVLRDKVLLATDSRFVALDTKKSVELALRDIGLSRVEVVVEGEGTVNK